MIAVNNAARPLGVKRQMHVQRDILALKGGEEVRVPHVLTYDIQDCARLKDFELDDSEAMDENVEIRIYKYHDEIGARDKPPAQDSNKVCLDPYRHASQQIWKNVAGTLHELSALKKGNGGELFVIERASVDEAYIDITDLVAACDLTSIIKDDTEFIGHPASPPDELQHAFAEADRNILLATHVAQHIRHALTAALGYTISIGVAHNKTLAKLASAMHKPDQQTYILAGMVPSVMRRVPFERLRFLGGKLGQAVTHGGDEGEEDEEREREQLPSAAIPPTSTMMASDVALMTVEMLNHKVSDMVTAKWIHGIVHGHDASLVTPRMAAKSLLSSKAFSALLKDWQELEGWLRVMAVELWSRLRYDIVNLKNHRWPQTLTLHFYGPNTPGRGRTRSMAFPVAHPRTAKPMSFLADALIGFCKKEARSGFLQVPLAYLQVGIGRFVDVNNFEEWVKQRHPGMSSYLKRKEDVVDAELEGAEDDTSFGTPLLPPLHTSPLNAKRSGRKRSAGRTKQAKLSFRAKQGADPRHVQEGTWRWACPECSFVVMDEGQAQGEVEGMQQQHEDYHLAVKLSVMHDE